MEIIWAFWAIFGMICGAIAVHLATNDVIEKKDKEVQYYKSLVKFYYKLAMRKRVKDE